MNRPINKIPCRVTTPLGLPPKSPEVEKAQPMRVVMAVLEQMRNPPVVARRTHPAFASVRAAVLGFARITIQELWSIRDARAFDLREGRLRIPAKRVVERYTTVRGHGVMRVAVEQQEARVIPLGSEAIAACRQYLAYPDKYHGGGKLTKFGHFSLGSFRQSLRSGSQSAGLPYPVSPSDFGTDRAPSPDEVRALVHAMRHDVVAYRPTADRTRNVKASIRVAPHAQRKPGTQGQNAVLQP